MINRKNRLTRLAKKIAADNAAFEAMTPAEKRVQIAKDMIVRVEMGQLKPTKGVLATVSSEKEGIDDFDFDDASLKDLCNTDDTLECTVCAKGGLFMSYVGRTNEATPYDLTYGNDIDGFEHEKLLEIFSAEQLALIEAAFEGRLLLEDEEGHDVEVDEKILDKAIDKYYDKYNNNEKRFIKIAKNIIKNNGTFIP